MSESELQKQILKYLNSIGAYVVKTIRTNRVGTPDILCCLNGKFIAIEVKRPSVDCVKGLSVMQERHIAEINNSGGVAFCTNSLEKVKRILNVNE